MPSTIAIAISALAGAAAALPATTATATLGAPLARTTNFGLSLEAEAPYNGLSLVVESSDTIGIKNIIFERPSAFEPSPLYLNGTEDEIESYAYLNFPGTAADGGDFGVRLPEAGHNEGNANVVEVLFGAQNPAFSIANGELAGQLTGTTNQFYACNVTFNGTYSPATTRLGLKWGNNFLNNSLPEDCVAAKLKVVDLSKYAS